MAVVETYSPSGKIAWKSLSWALPIGLGIGAAMGALYAVLGHWNLLAYIPLSIFFVSVGDIGALLFFAGGLFGVAMAAFWMCQLARNRNPAIAMALGFGVGLFSLYVHWMTLGLLAGDVFVLPHEVFHMQSAMIRDGWRAWVFDAPGMTWAFWGIEAIGFIGAGVFGAHTAAKDPYCESCGTWADAEEVIDFPFATSPDRLAARLQAGEVASLAEFVPQNDPLAGFHRYRFTLKKCPDCDRLNVLNVEEVTIHYDDDGEAVETLEDVVAGLLVSHPQLRALRDVFAGPTPPAPLEQDESGTNVITL